MHSVIFFICAITESCNLIFKKWNKEGPISHFYEVFSSGVYGLLGVARWRSSRISWTASCGFKCLCMCRLKSSGYFPVQQVQGLRSHTAARRGDQCFSLLLCLSREERTKITPGFLTDPLQAGFFLACVKWQWCSKPCKWVLAPMDSYLFLLSILSVKKAERLSDLIRELISW